VNDCQDVKKQSRVKRKELNKLLGYTIRHLKDKVQSPLVCRIQCNITESYSPN